MHFFGSLRPLRLTNTNFFFPRAARSSQCPTPQNYKILHNYQKIMHIFSLPPPFFYQFFDIVGALRYQFFDIVGALGGVGASGRPRSCGMPRVSRRPLPLYQKHIRTKQRKKRSKKKRKRGGAYKRTTSYEPPNYPPFLFPPTKTPKKITKWMQMAFSVSPGRRGRRPPREKKKFVFATSADAATQKNALWQTRKNNYKRWPRVG